VAHRALRPDEIGWITRPHEPGEPARHVAELSEAAGLRHVRANVWRYEPGAAGRRHQHPSVGGIVHVEAGTPLQTVNHGDTDLVVYVHGWPPEETNAELLDSAV
jgi:quercetin dioxygenase-like cupin family protein